MRGDEQPTAPRPGGLGTVTAGEAGRFLVAGFVAYACDVGVFNLLLLGVGMGPLWSKVLAGAVAITVAFVGNHRYTWPHALRGRLAPTYAAFVGFSVAAVGIQVLTIYVANTWLGLSGPLADNVSGNIVGMGLATIFRFVTFRRFVFRVT